MADEEVDGFAAAAHWNLEQSYENQPRLLKRQKEKREPTRLPIKTAHGIVHRPEPALPSPAESDESGNEDGNGEWGGIEDETPQEPVPYVPERQRVLEAKEELAKLATQINEDPEENIGMFKRMRERTEDSSPTIVKLALATQLAVYKDVIPGYRIRPLTDEEQRAKVSREVKKLRSFEQMLVSQYQAYVGTLTKLARAGHAGGAESATAAVSMVAVNCACGLLLHVPHFNFRTELLKILVERLSARSANDVFRKCTATLEELFATDEDGHASLDAVQLLTRMMKARKYAVHPAALNTLLHLRLLSELDAAGSYERVDMADDSGKRKRGDRKKDREFRTKKMRKTHKELQKVAAELQEADATVSHEMREKCQAETLKLVFVAYFQILKLRPAALMGATLEGLSKYARLINLDFYGDILVALREMITSTMTDETAADSARNPTREALLCIITAFTLQATHASSGSTTVSTDLSFFVSHLYNVILPLCLSASLEDHPPSPSSTPTSTSSSSTSPSPSTAPPTRVTASTETELLLRALELVLFRPDAHTFPSRLAAFTKRTLTASLHAPEKSATALHVLLARLARKHPRRLKPLWHTEDTVGDGTYNPEAQDVERANPYAATAWEGVLLRSHYSPKVREVVKKVEDAVAEGEKEKVKGEKGR